MRWVGPQPRGNLQAHCWAPRATSLLTALVLSRTPAAVAAAGRPESPATGLHAMMRLKMQRNAGWFDNKSSCAAGFYKPLLVVTVIKCDQTVSSSGERNRQSRGSGGVEPNVGCAFQPGKSAQFRLPRDASSVSPLFTPGDTPPGARGGRGPPPLPPALSLCLLYFPDHFCFTRAQFESLSAPDSGFTPCYLPEQKQQYSLQASPCQREMPLVKLRGLAYYGLNAHACVMSHSDTPTLFKACWPQKVDGKA